MIIIPLSGALFVATARQWVPMWALPNIPYSTASIPHFSPHAPLQRRQIMALSLDLHTWLAFATAGLLAIHVGAALLHQFFRQDDVLSRMTPRFAGRQDAARPRRL
jgi:cytochrome b561